jgi:hypothetical protein
MAVFDELLDILERTVWHSKKRRQKKTPSVEEARRRASPHRYASCLRNAT